MITRLQFIQSTEQEPSIDGEKGAALNDGVRRQQLKEAMLVDILKKYFFFKVLPFCCSFGLKMEYFIIHCKVDNIKN